MDALARKAVLVTGADRGLGRELVDEALSRDAARVFAGTLQPLAHPDPRVVPIPLDVTDEMQVRAAAERVGSLDLLVNNAGIAIYDDLSDRAVLEQHLAVNLFGPWRVMQAFLPALTRSRGAIVNVLSLAALAALPSIPSYSISKAASWSMSQSLRAMLAPRGVAVHAVLAGPIDTEMSRDFAVAKAPAKSVARAVLDAVERGEEEIFPDAVSAKLAEGWRNSIVKELERQNKPS